MVDKVKVVYTAVGTSKSTSDLATAMAAQPVPTDELNVLACSVFSDMTTSSLYTAQRVIEILPAGTGPVDSADLLPLFFEWMKPQLEQALSTPIDADDPIMVP